MMVKAFPGLTLHECSHRRLHLGLPQEWKVLRDEHASKEHGVGNRKLQNIINIVI